MPINSIILAVCFAFFALLNSQLIVSLVYILKGKFEHLKQDRPIAYELTPAAIILDIYITTILILEKI